MTTTSKLESEVKHLREENRELLLALNKSAATDALDAIAKLCGVAEWDYPGQVVRDVALVLGRFRSALRGEIMGEHAYNGACPDRQEGVLSRDPECDQCKRLTELKLDESWRTT